MLFDQYGVVLEAAQIRCGEYDVNLLVNMLETTPHGNAV